MDQQNNHQHDQSAAPSGTVGSVVVCCWMCNATPAHRRRNGVGGRYREPVCDDCAAGMLRNGYPMDPEDIHTHNTVLCKHHI